jgi:hypothetical protein
MGVGGRVMERITKLEYKHVYMDMSQGTPPYNYHMPVEMFKK